MLAIVLGFICFVALAVMHHLLLMSISHFTPRQSLSRRRLTTVVFSALLFIHLVEIGVLSIMLRLLHAQFWPASLGVAFQGTWQEWFYLSGMLFSTLGYSTVPAMEPFNLLLMIVSLGGFMVLTWSATYLFSACGRYWGGEGE